MRIAYKIAVSLLIWPLAIAAQDYSGSGQFAPPKRDLSGAQDMAAPSNGANTSEPSGPEPAPIPVLVQPAPAFLFTRPQKAPPAAPAGHAPELNFAAGFSVTSMGLPSSGRAALTGVNVSAAMDTGRRAGLKLDIGYERAPNVYSSGHSVSLLNYLVGPVFYPTNGTQLSTYAHALFGGARVTGPFSIANGVVNVGYVNYPAWAIGGGAEYRLSPAFGFRVGVDYMHTHFYNVSGAVRGQNVVQVVSSIVYYLRNPFRRN